MSKGYKATAVRWGGGWELHIEGEGVTQVRSLANAAQQVRDYLETVHERDFSDIEVEIAHDLGGVEREVAAAAAEVAEATAALAAAAAHARAVALRLHDEVGLSVTDTGAVLGVSKGRASQLLAEARELADAKA